jgi:hypothetical protein
MPTQRAPQVIFAIRAGGTTLLVKGSPGLKMKTNINALTQRFPGETALDQAAV